MDAELFTALADPTRLRIVELLRREPRSVNAIAGELALRQPQVSKHLATLSRAGLVTVHPRAQRRYYALEPGPFARLGEWSATFEQVWTERLGRLDAFLTDTRPTSPTRKGATP